MTANLFSLHFLRSFVAGSGFVSVCLANHHTLSTKMRGLAWLELSWSPLP